MRHPNHHPRQKKNHQPQNPTCLCPPPPLELDGGLQRGSALRGGEEEVPRRLELDVDGGLVGHPKVFLEEGEGGYTDEPGWTPPPLPPKITHIPPPLPKITQHTLMLRRNLAEKRDMRIFSGRENCCRIPPTDSTVEAWEY